MYVFIRPKYIAYVCLYINTALVWYWCHRAPHVQNKTWNTRLENFHSLKSQIFILPSGLMVFSSDSLSFDFPLDMSAAMEKAFALEESCGFGEEVYSMMRVLKTILNSTNVQMKPRSYFKSQDDISVRIE